MGECVLWTGREERHRQGRVREGREGGREGWGEDGRLGRRGVKGKEEKRRWGKREKNKRGRVGRRERETRLGVTRAHTHTHTYTHTYASHFLVYTYTHSLAGLSHTLVLIHCLVRHTALTSFSVGWASLPSDRPPNTRSPRIMLSLLLPDHLFTTHHNNNNYIASNDLCQKKYGLSIRTPPSLRGLVAQLYRFFVSFFFFITILFSFSSSSIVLVK